MLKLPTLRKRLLTAVLAAVVLASAPVPAHAASKEIIELQTQVQQLLDMVQRLQSTVDSRFGIMQHLVEQTADNATQITATVNALQLKINAQSDAGNGKLDTVSGQVQSLNDSVDELKTRIAKLDKSVQDLQTQLQNVQSPPPAAASSTQVADPNAQPPAGGAPAPQGAAPTDQAQAPPLKETFQAGMRDYNAARYDVAAGEFQDVLHNYPLDELAGSAQFYLGEIAYRQQNYPDAIKAYNAVLESFSGSPKAPAAQLRKGYALLAEGKKEAGVHELRALIQRHPQTPEAAQARSKLNGMGVRISAGR
ncbi:MAG: tetratricopeptide repeat protein [Terracidiphilus sp.]|jgi:tol-pal system protein YbgF